MGAQREILEDFQSESKSLIQDMLELLDESEGNFESARATSGSTLEKYGQTVDRIMGAAKSLTGDTPSETEYLKKIGDYAALCKAVGYKTSQITDNEAFYDICVALLIDATEMLQTLNAALLENKTSDKETFSQTFLERLSWVSAKFGQEYRTTVATGTTTQSTKMGQTDIDDLLKKLGL